MRFAWRFRWHCAALLLLQLVLLGMGMLGLGLVGAGLDTIAHAVDPGQKPAQFPFGVAPPRDLPALQAVAWAAAGVVVLALFRAWLTYVYQMANARLLQEKIVPELREAVYRKLQVLGPRFHAAHDSGSLFNRVTGDVQNTRLFVDGVLLQAAILALSLVTYLVYMFQIHVGLTLACLGTTPLLWMLSSRFSTVMRPAYLKNRELMDRLILDFSETVRGVHTVKAFAAEGQRIQHFEAANRSVSEQQMGIFRTISLFTPSIHFLTHLNLVVLLAYGGWLYIHDEISLGSGLLVLAGLLQQFSGQIANLSGIANSVQQSLTSARRVFEVLDTPEEVANAVDPLPIAGRLSGAVRFEGVGFRHGDGLWVLRDISFEVQAGSVVGVFGRTGSGKSTLLSLIPRFVDPTEGRVLLDGRDARSLDLTHLRRQTGVVYQESFLFSNTVAANICFGDPGASEQRMRKAAALASADGFIERMPLGYETVLGEAGVDLSGGQRQRISLARALLLEPPLLILDDPTASVDAHTETEIVDALRIAARGRTTFVASNRLSLLRRADIILVLDAGRLVDTGSHSELMTRDGPYRRAAELQFAEWQPEGKERSSP